MNVFLVTKLDGTVLPATNVRTFEDRGGAQSLALVYRNRLTTVPAADVAGVAFGLPPSPPPPPPAVPTQEDAAA